MTGNEKRKALIVLGLVMIITVIIAASLPQLELQPGMPPPILEDNQVVLAPIEEVPLMTISINKFIEILFEIVLTVLMLYVIYRLLKGINRKISRSDIKIIVVSTLIVGSFLFLILLVVGSQNTDSIEMPVPSATPLVTSPLGPTPPLLLWLVGIGLLVSSIFFGIGVFGSTSNQAKTKNAVGVEAKKAWQALNIGMDLKDVIVQCYRQMSQILEKEQGLERERSMTTGEFEKLLEAAGIPYEPIHQLTQLFETVRYSNRQPDPMDNQNAIQCLEAIMLYSRDVKGTD